MNKATNESILSTAISPIALLVMNYQVARIPDDMGKAKFNLHESDSFRCFFLNTKYHKLESTVNFIGKNVWVQMILP